MDILQDSNVSIVNSARANYLRVKCPDEGKIDRIALNVMLEDRPPFLMPVQPSIMNDLVTLDSQLTVGEAISSGLKDKSLSKSEYLKLAASLLTPFQTCREWFLDYHNIIIDPHFIIRDRISGSYLFIYIPYADFESGDDEILEFFRRTLIKIDISDDAVFQTRIMRYLTSEFSLDGLNELIKREFENPAPAVQRPTQTTETPRQPVKPTPAPEQPKPVEKPQTPAVTKKDTEKPEKRPARPAHERDTNQRSGFFDFLINRRRNDPFADMIQSDEVKSDGVKSDDLDALFGGKENVKKPEKKAQEAKSGLFKQSKPTAKAPSSAEERVKPLKQTQDPPRPIEVDTGYGASEETSIGGFEARDELQLIDSRFEGAPELIPLDFKSGSAIIGRRNSESKPDIEFPETCKGVGRRHARITRKKDGGYTICDLGSQYGTLIDGQRLTPNLEYELRDGMTLVFVEERKIRYRVVLAGGSDIL